MALQLVPARPSLGIAKRNRARQLLLLSGALVTIVSALVILATASINVLSAVRAYVAGEGLWSKGQKDAVFFLTQYARTHADADYQRFVAAIKAPQGDHVARIELGKPGGGDTKIARQGFL